MLTEICAEIRNYFSLREDHILGEFAVIDGAITPEIPLADNQYYRIIGSVYNDGVHQNGDTKDVLTDEGYFRGAIWKMRVPQAVIDLSHEIAAWQTENGSASSANMSPFNSESFGGYSYSKSSGTSASGAGSSAVTWQAVYKKRLDPYRRARVL